MKDETILSMTAMILITAAVLFALSLGIDGVMFTTFLIALSGLAGYKLKAGRSPAS